MNKTLFKARHDLRAVEIIHQGELGEEQIIAQPNMRIDEETINNFVDSLNNYALKHTEHRPIDNPDNGEVYFGVYMVGLKYQN